MPGYQIPAAAMRWVAGDGTKPFHDPIRVPNAPEGGGKTNPFFIELYRSVALQTKGLDAREHTAQVPYETRERREDAFRAAQLPVLFCSPTMELGVDIAELNVVNMRNVPPTPANYAQRSGRAGRSGQPALVFTYCSTGSSHDQYFFKRPQRMVAGAVSTAPPRSGQRGPGARPRAGHLARGDGARPRPLAARKSWTSRATASTLPLLASVQDTVADDKPRQRAARPGQACPGLAWAMTCRTRTGTATAGSTRS